jgi:hypothetical protein
MPDNERHEMRLQRTFPSGAQEWLCPECRRWVVLHHEAAQGRLKTVVLEAGDERTAHHGGTEGVSMSSPRIAANGGPDKGWLH